MPQPKKSNSCSQRKISISEKVFFEEVIPQEFRDCDLDDCSKIKPEYIALCKGWAKSSPTPSLFLSGNYGTGKTYLAFAFIREIYKNYPGIYPKFYSSPDLDGLLRISSMKEDGDLFIINELGSCDLLFIDDVGRETKSERSKRQYYHLIDKRYGKRLPTIITSNLTLGEIGQTIDGAIASRMQRWAQLRFEGIDFRSQNE